MSFQFVAHRGSANNKTSGAVLTVSPSAQVNVGAILVADCISDNIQNAAATEDHVVTDFKGNRWEKIFERTNAAVAGGGVTLSQWICRVTTPIGTSDTIVLGIRAATTAKAIGLREYSLAASSSFVVAGVSFTEQDGTSSPTVTLNNLQNGISHAFLGVCAREDDNAGTYNQDADYNDRTKFGTTGGTGNTNVSCIVGDRLASISSDTFAPTNLSVAADVVTALVALVEVPGYSITIQAANNDGTNLNVTYSRKGDSGGHGVQWPLNRLDDFEITADQLEEFLLRSFLTNARARNLTAANMVGKSITAFPRATRSLITID